MNHGYKAKTISGIISRKIDSWLQSIDDVELRNDTKQGVTVTGGAIASMLLGEPVSDFDVYLRTPDLAERLAKYYLGKFTPKKKNGIDVPLYVIREGDRVRVVAKSAGIASAESTEKPYEYFEGSAPESAGEYVGEVMEGVTTNPGEADELAESLQEGAVETANAEDPTKPKYRPIFLSSNAITLSDKIQVVLRFTGNPEEIHTNYDFIHCTNYWSSWGTPALVLNLAALESLMARELRYVGSLYPLCSIIRTRKFLKRGWSINAGQYLKMIMQCGDLNLKDFNVLQDQLTGVDVAYFAQLLSAVKDLDAEKVNTAYVVEIIDRMF